MLDSVICGKSIGMKQRFSRGDIVSLFAADRPDYRYNGLVGGIESYDRERQIAMVRIDPAEGYSEDLVLVPFSVLHKYKIGDKEIA